MIGTDRSGQAPAPRQISPTSHCRFFAAARLTTMPLTAARSADWPRRTRTDNTASHQKTKKGPPRFPGTRCRHCHVPAPGKCLSDDGLPPCCWLASGQNGGRLGTPRDRVLRSIAEPQMPHQSIDAWLLPNAGEGLHSSGVPAAVWPFSQAATCTGPAEWAKGHGNREGCGLGK